jgi:V/A-type H+-transporting ATPase subunit E
MTGIENITGKIQADAQAEIDRIQADAAAEAEKITAGYEAQAEKDVADILAKGEKNADERGARLVSAAQMEAKKMTLAAKQEMLDQAFALALEKLIQLPEDEYVDFLAKLAVKASRTGSEKMILNQADRARYGVKAATRANEMLVQDGKTGSITLSEETRDIQGGLLLSDGAIEVNCAFETLVRLVRSEVTGEVSKVLFN